MSESRIITGARFGTIAQVSLSGQRLRRKESAVTDAAALCFPQASFYTRN